MTIIRGNKAEYKDLSTTVEMTDLIEGLAGWDLRRDWMGLRRKRKDCHSL